MMSHLVAFEGRLGRDGMALPSSGPYQDILSQSLLPHRDGSLPQAF
jgi:hypothetical protein